MSTYKLLIKCEKRPKIKPPLFNNSALIYNRKGLAIDYILSIPHNLLLRKYEG